VSFAHNINFTFGETPKKEKNQMEINRQPLKDAVLQTYIPRRIMATLILHFEKEGIEVNSMSDLIRTVLQYFSQIAVNEWGAREVLSSEDATEIIKRKFPKIEMNPGGRMLPAYMKNIKRESFGTQDAELPTERTNRLEEEIEAEIEASIPSAIENFLEKMRRERGD
jgi:hypothetical protein